MILNRGKRTITSLLIISLFYIPFTQSGVIPTTNQAADELARRRNELKSSNWECAPKPTLIYLKDVHMNRTHPNIKWTPAEAILYRCDKSTGYCGNSDKTCQPKATAEVEVLFYWSDIITHEQKYETLRFVNHTACECRP